MVRDRGSERCGFVIGALGVLWLKEKGGDGCLVQADVRVVVGGCGDEEEDQ